MNAKGIPQAYKLAIICIVLFINAGFVAAMGYEVSSHNTENTNAWLGFVGTQNYICSNFSINATTMFSDATIKLKRTSSIPTYINVSIWTLSAGKPSKLIAQSNGIIDSSVSLVTPTEYNFTLNRTIATANNYSICARMDSTGMATMEIRVDATPTSGNWKAITANLTPDFTTFTGGKLYYIIYGNASNASNITATNLTLDSVSISPSPITLDIDDLKGYARATDLRGYTINYTWAWYNGTTLYSMGNYTNAPPNISVNLANISAAITTIKSNWTFSAKADSHNATTGWINSSLTFVREFMIANCSTYNYTIWNVSYFDEYSLLPITAMNTYDLIFSYPFQQQLSGTGSGKEYDAFCSSEDISGVYNITAYGSFKLDKTGYTTRIYNKDLASAYNIIPPKQNLSLFMISIGNTSTVLFNTYDNYDKSQLIAGVQEDMYQIILGVPVYMESRISDITGKAEFSYIANKQYRFIFQKSGYKNYTFDLNPIQQISYDVFMNPVAGTNVSGNFDRVAINIMPQIFYTGANRLNFTIASFYGELTSYSYTLTYPGGTTTNSGSNSNGETLNSNINIINPALFDEVQIDIFYTLPVFGTKSMTYFYPIGNMTNNTLMNPPNQDATYGMGLIERLLIVIFGAILIAGLCYLGGMEIPGMLLQFTWSGIWCYLNFVPFWAFLPSIFIAMIIISSRST